jgi:N-acyl homoserine lactone hydrolase
MNSKIHVLHTGYVYIDRALAFREKSLHPAPYTGWFRSDSKKMWVPVSSYLIEHPKGLVLVDTGWNTEVRTNAKKHIGFLANSMFRTNLPEGQAIHEQLKSLGFSDQDLEYVVLTHLHSDHVSGLPHVSRAKNIVVSDLEWTAGNKDIGYVKSMWKGIPIKPISLQTISHGPFKLGIDLFEDGTLFLIHTPGHSKGQLSVMVSIRNKWVLLASDVGYATSSWEDNILPGITVNEQHAQASLDWVKQFSESPDCLAVLANHDPNIVPITIC